MPEYTTIDTYQITITQNTVTALDVGDRGGQRVIVRPDPGNGSTVLVGPSVNKAGSALSATTGFPLYATDQPLELDLVLGEDRGDGTYPACFSAGVSQKLHVLVLAP